MSRSFYSSCCLIAIFSLKTVLADNLFLEQIKQVSIKESDTKLHERIKKFQNRKTYTIKNLPSFHKQNEKKQEAETLCQNCHGRLPHRKNSSIRAFLNQHNQRIDCLTCHYQPENISLKYGWSNTTASKKIVPLAQGNPLPISAKHPFSLQVKESWEQGDLYQKDRVYQKIHQPLSETKLKCSDCHQNKGLLDLEALNFKPEEINKIEKNRISHFLSDLKPTDDNKPEDKIQQILLRSLLQ